MKKLLLLIAMVLTVCSTAMAQDGPANNEIWYTSSDGNVVTPSDDAFNVSIVSNDYKDGQGVITFSGELTTIGSLTFNYKTTLTSVTIPASVTSINNCAFSNCSQLETLTFANYSQLETIGGQAFSDANISDLTIPATVTSIGDEAFWNCSQLKQLTFADDSQLETIGDEAFYCAAIEGALNIPASVHSIGKSAFSKCSQLSSLAFDEGSQLESIGAQAFDGTGIEGTLKLPASLKKMEEYAFKDCQLTIVYMNSEDLSEISGNSFIETAVIIFPVELYEAYKEKFTNNKVEVPLEEWKEYTIAQIKDAMKTANTLSPTDKTTIAGYISTIENATTFEETTTVYHAALALIDQQKALEEKVKDVLETWGTKQEGPAIEIVGKDGKAIQLYNIENVKFIKVSTEE